MEKIDFIDVKPSAKATISYPSGVEVDLGKELTPTQVKDQPTVTWEADAGSLYTLLLLNPAPPVREELKFKELLHWAVINIPGNKVADGQVLAEYIGSVAQEGLGLLRYVFLVFKQTEKITTDELLPKGIRDLRRVIKTRDYIAKYNLGAPVAGNFFEAQYDDYVPILQAQLK
ncbi:uncharacterized protein Dwil_GK11700 [Drosophila willistoni]|uniref:Uncharacterized protein n=1 Tax=Drosophila willistoni TaxID=7260 RepID=B4NAE5_DROWI|nr:phosphatidylethanolamine-binding protein homolog F40A3.3 [Drosophila willistoni]EDW80759.1 uncharacterized protein Dwil_GK11700 [Drosophila willistoni]